MIVVTSSFSKSFVLKIFSVHTKTQSMRFQISNFKFEKRFRKPSFSLRIGVDGRPDLLLIPPGRGVKLLISNGSLRTGSSHSVLRTC